MSIRPRASLGATALCATTGRGHARDTVLLTIANVNNGDRMRMQNLDGAFAEELPAPPGTGSALHENEEYQGAAPFARTTLNSMEAARQTSSSARATPFTGGRFVAIPEFQDIGTAAGQTFSAALAGQRQADRALASARSLTRREIDRAGYGSD